MAALPVARLRSQKPVVTVVHKGFNVIVEAQDSSALSPGDIVRTNASGKAHIIFSNGTRIALGTNSRLQIVSAETPDSPLTLRLFGALSTLWVKPRGNTLINTRAANAAARGTEFLVRLLTADTTEVTVTEGSVDFFNAQGRVQVKERQQSTAQAGQAPTAPKVVDVTGLVEWTASVVGLPIEFETPFTNLDAQHLAQAQQQAEAALKREPDNTVLQRRLGEIYYDRGQYAAAARQFNAALQRGPDAATLIALGRAELGQGDVPAALQAFQRAEALDPTDATPHIYEALSHLAQMGSTGNPQTVLEKARAALPPAGQPGAGQPDAEQPTQRQALTQAVTGLIELHEGHNVEAIRDLEAAVAQDPMLYQAQSLLGLAYLTQGQLPPALKAAQAAVHLCPDSAQAQGTFAYVLFFLKRPQEARQAAQQALAHNPFSAIAQLTIGRLLLAQLRTDDALLAFQRAQALAPNLPLFELEAGAAYLRLDRPQKAEAAYRHALELEAQSATAHTGLGLALQLQGQEVAALHEHQAALRLEPHNSTAQLNLANLLLMQGNLNAAEQTLRQSVNEQPDRGLVYARLAELSLYRQNLLAAQQFARRAVGLLPDSAIAHYVLGRVYWEQMHFLQAEEEFRHAVALDPQLANAHYGLGLAQEQNESELFIAPTIALGPGRSVGSDFLGSPGQALSLQNLQTPGVEERLQAALQDPTVIRTATRAFGDTELSGLIGAEQTQTAAVSHLEETSNQRGITGLTLEHQTTHGTRTDAGDTAQRIGLTWGQKARNDPSSLLVVGQLAQDNEGANTGPTDNSTLAFTRTHTELPLLLLGFNLHHQESQQTRFLMQLNRPREQSGNPRIPANRLLVAFRSLSAEVRHDAQIGSQHLVLGALLGHRQQEISSDIFLTRFQITDQAEHANRIQSAAAYIRDEVRLSRSLELRGEWQMQSLDFKTQQQDIAPMPGPLKKTRRNTVAGLYNVVAAYQPNARSGLRLRARSLLGAVQDFRLLAPVDVFLLSLTGYPELNLLGRGDSQELEYDYTFRSAAFLRLGLFRQNLRDAGVGFESAAQGLEHVRQQGAQISYEGILNRNVTYFANLNLISAKNLQLNDYVVGVPRWSGRLGFQYLNHQGWLLEPSLDYIGQRRSATVAKTSGVPLLNLRAGKRWGLRSVVFVDLSNALNQTYTAHDVLFPGRALRLGLSQRF